MSSVLHRLPEQPQGCTVGQTDCNPFQITVQGIVGGSVGDWQRNNLLQLASYQRGDKESLFVLLLMFGFFFFFLNAFRFRKIFYSVMFIRWFKEGWIFFISHMGEITPPSFTVFKILIFDHLLIFSFCTVCQYTSGTNIYIIIYTLYNTCYYMIYILYVTMWILGVLLKQ